MKGLVTRNTHMKYERSITSGLEVMSKVKVFVHATDADVEADGRAMTLAPRTYMSRLANDVLNRSQLPRLDPGIEKNISSVFPCIT